MTMGDICPSPTQGVDKKLDRLHEWARSQTKDYKAKLDKFKTDLDRHPAHAMEWAEASVSAAAHIEELRQFMIGLQAVDEGKCELTDVRDRLVGEVLRQARTCMPNSSSAMHNLTKLARLEADARILDHMKWHDLEG